MTTVPERHSRYGFPVTTVLLTVLMILVFQMELRALEWGIIERMMEDFSFVWTDFVAAPFENLPRFISHTLLHANQSHIVGNVVFFLLFAPAVERATGHVKFAFLYLVWGVGAALTQGLFEPFSAGMIGASGAISGAAGAYFVLFPLKTPPSIVSRILGRWVARIPAFFLIGLWFVGQLEGGFRAVLPDLAPGSMAPIAYWAHIGGFAAGALTSAPAVLFPPKKVA